MSARVESKRHDHHVVQSSPTEMVPQHRKYVGHGEIIIQYHNVQGEQKNSDFESKVILLQYIKQTSTSQQIIKHS